MPKGLALALLLLGVAARADDLQIERVQKYGCSISQQTNGWNVIVWADRFEASQYRRVLSVRDTRKKAFSDCDDWMEDVKKQLHRYVSRQLREQADKEEKQKKGK